MEAHNWKERRPRRAIAACIALGLALAAVLVVLHPTLRGPQGLAGNSDYRAILGYEPAPGVGLRGLERDAQSTDAGTRSATAATVKPADPAAHTVSVEAKPMAGGEPAPTGASDGTAKDTSGGIQSDADTGTYAGAKAANDLKPSLPADKGDPVAAVSGWFTEPSKDRGIPAASLATLTPPNDKDKLCEWKYELVDAKDANGDGHPEYVHVRGLCIYEKDANADGNPEISLKMARDFEAWDNDSNGVFNVLVGKQGLMAFADPNSNGKHEVEAKALWNLEMKDEIEDQKPELVRFRSASTRRMRTPTGTPRSPSRWPGTSRRGTTIRTACSTSWSGSRASWPSQTRTATGSTRSRRRRCGISR